MLVVVDEVFVIDPSTAQRAKEIVLGRRTLSARDALHLVVMELHGVERIFAFDEAFDAFPGIARVG